MTRPEESRALLTVFTSDHDHTAYSYSPFCTKLHFRLRHGEIAYTDGQGSRGKAPKKKIPYVRFEDTGTLMGDTSLVIQKLVELGKLEDLNTGLSPDTRAADYALRAMIEDRLYYFLVSPESPLASGGPGNAVAARILNVCRQCACLTNKVIPNHSRRCTNDGSSIVQR